MQATVNRHKMVFKFLTRGQSSRMFPYKSIIYSPLLKHIFSISRFLSFRTVELSTRFWMYCRIYDRSCFCCMVSLYFSCLVKNPCLNKISTVISYMTLRYDYIHVTVLMCFADLLSSAL